MNGLHEAPGRYYVPKSSFKFEIAELNEKKKVIFLEHEASDLRLRAELSIGNPAPLSQEPGDEAVDLMICKEIKIERMKSNKPIVTLDSSLIQFCYKACEALFHYGLSHGITHIMFVVRGQEFAQLSQEQQKWLLMCASDVCSVVDTPDGVYSEEYFFYMPTTVEAYEWFRALGQANCIPVMSHFWSSKN